MAACIDNFSWYAITAISGNLGRRSCLAACSVAAVDTILVA